MELTLQLPYRKKVVFKIHVTKLSVESVPEHHNFSEDARAQALEKARQSASIMYGHNQVW